ncbi:DUF3440 domain-containing protein [Streptomyces sp. NPDC087897]|uniref:DUF3440 domain-containing protein n=1 Tax=Streptomyces sp. NPDC087897 TaxID=3365817 RepID=UPI00381EB3AF
MGARAVRAKVAVFLDWYSVRGYPGGAIPDDGPNNRSVPSWKRVCKTILSNDYWCKGLSFAPPASSEAYRTYRRNWTSSERNGATVARSETRVMTNTDPDFSPVVGPYLANRTVAKSLGGPIWDDPGKTWIVRLDASGDLAGFVAVTGRGKVESLYTAPAATSCAPPWSRPRSRLPARGS